MLSLPLRGTPKAAFSLQGLRICHFSWARVRRQIALSAVAAVLSTAASATETLRYTYDSRGRLVQVFHDGAISQGARATYQYDSADNRYNVTVATAWTSMAFRTSDFNGDGRSDILWRADAGMQAPYVAGVVTDWLSSSTGGWTDNWSNSAAGADLSWKVVGIADFNGDGRADILWRQDGGNLTTWLNNGTTNWNGGPGYSIPPDWKIVGVADFNGDGRPDILWRQSGGQLTDWLGGTGGTFTDNSSVASTFVSPDWKVAAVGDFNGDGRSDILWRQDGTGVMLDWLGTSTGGFTSNSSNYADTVALDWKVVGAGDFNGDGRSDILWRRDDGTLTETQGTATGAFASTGLYYNVSTDWRVAVIGNFNGPTDQIDDLLWRNRNGDLVQWLGRSSGDFISNSAASNSVATTWNLEPR